MERSGGCQDRAVRSGRCGLVCPRQARVLLRTGLQVRSPPGARGAVRDTNRCHSMGSAVDPTVCSLSCPTTPQQPRKPVCGDRTPQASPPPKCVHTRLGPPALERALDAGGASRLWSHTRRLYSLGNVGAYTRVVTLPSAYEHTRTLTHTLEGLSVLSLSRSAKAKAVSHPAARPPGQMALMRSAPSRHLPPSPAVRRRLCTSPAGWFGVGR